MLAKNLSANLVAIEDADINIACYILDENSGNYKKLGIIGHEILDNSLAAEIRPSLLCGDSPAIISPVRINCLAEEAKWQAIVVEKKVQSLLVLPMIIHSLMIGIIIISANRIQAFNNDDFNNSNIMAKQLAFAFRRALLYNKVQLLAITDEQTGLYVHSYFQERLSQEIKRAERYRQALSLIILDVDKFKVINDTYGHQVGDEVLIEVAARIEEMAGSAALVARYGGEEFAVLLPNTAKTIAEEIAGNINLFIKKNFICLAGNELKVTISGGVSTYPEDAVEQEELMSIADKALYQAKEQGRDRIILAKPYKPLA